MLHNESSIYQQYLLLLWAYTWTTINPFHAKYFIICQIKCKRWVNSEATAGFARHIQQFRISKLVSLLVWDWVRLFRLDYSTPVQGYFTSHDFGELPHIMFLFIAPIQKWAIWLGLWNIFYFNSRNFDLEVTFDRPKCCMIRKARPCRIPHVFMWLIHLVDPQLQPSYQNTCIFLKWPPLSLDHGMNLGVKGLVQLKLKYEWDRGYIYISKLLPN